MKKFIFIYLLISFASSINFADSDKRLLERIREKSQDCYWKVAENFFLTKPFVKIIQTLKMKNDPFTKNNLKTLQDCFPNGLKSETSKESKFSQECLALRLKAENVYKDCLTNDKSGSKECKEIVAMFGDSGSDV